MTFLIMLLPRARQKVAMGKEEMFDYTEAREEHSHTRHQVSSREDCQQSLVEASRNFAIVFTMFNANAAK